MRSEQALCAECGRHLPPPKVTENGRQSGRRRSFCSQTCQRRHARRKNAGDAANVVGPHATDTAELVEAFKVQRGEDYSAQDVAEVGHLQSVAVALDANPADTVLLREFRITLAYFRRATADSGASPAAGLAEFLAAAVAEARDS